MDDGMTQVAEACFRNARENPGDIARWLAVEVLLADPAGLEDDPLAERLLALQDRLEVQARVRYGLPAEPGRRLSSRVPRWPGLQSVRFGPCGAARGDAGAAGP